MFCMNRVDIAMGLLDRVKMVVVVVSVDVVFNINVVVVNVVVICLSTTYTGLTSRWVVGQGQDGCCCHQS